MIELYDTPAPLKPKIVDEVDALRVIDRELKASMQAHKDLRYGYFLRKLPIWILEGILWAQEGDEAAARTLTYLTIRVGELVYKNQNPVLLAGRGQLDADAKNTAENKFVVAATQNAHVHVCCEIMRRSGWLDFSPPKDPFSGDKPRKIALIKLGESLKGEERTLLDNVIAGPKPPEPTE